MMYSLLSLNAMQADFTFSWEGLKKQTKTNKQTNKQNKQTKQKQTKNKQKTNKQTKRCLFALLRLNQNIGK